MASRSGQDPFDKDTLPKEEKKEEKVSQAPPTDDAAASDETKDKFECDDATCHLPGHGHDGERSLSASRGDSREKRRMDRQSSSKSICGDQEGSAAQRRKSSSGKYYDIIFASRGDSQWYSAVRRRSAIHRLIHGDSKGLGDGEGKGGDEGKYFVGAGFPSRGNVFSRLLAWSWCLLLTWFEVRVPVCLC